MTDRLENIDYADYLCLLSQNTIDMKFKIKDLKKKEEK